MKEGSNVKYEQMVLASKYLEIKFIYQNLLAQRQKEKNIKISEVVHSCGCGGLYIKETVDDTSHLLLAYSYLISVFLYNNHSLKRK